MAHPNYPPMQHPGHPPMYQPGHPPVHSSNRPMQPSYPMYPSMPAGTSLPPASGPAPTVQPLTPTIVVAGPQFLLPYATKLTMKSKNWMTIGNFEICDSDDKLVLKVKRTYGLRTRRILVDANDNPIMTIQKKLMTTRERWVAYRGKNKKSKNKLFSIRAAKYFQSKENYNIYMAGNTSENVPDFQVKGSFFDRSCRIFLGKSNIAIATMDEEYDTDTENVMGKDIFDIDIEANVDYAFIAAVVAVAIALDKNNDSDEDGDMNNDNSKDSDSSEDDW